MSGSASWPVYRAVIALVAFGAVVTLAQRQVTARSTDLFVEEKSGVTIDWRRGAIIATGGAAPDHRMPSTDAARPGAERRARASARARIAEALRALPLGGTRRLDGAAVSRALERARSTGIEYQSNGGAVARVEVVFGDWAETARTGGAPDAGGTSGNATPIPLFLPEGRLAASPLVLASGKEISLGSVRYAPAAGLPAGTQPVAVHADKQGRLLVDGAGPHQELAGRPVVIYLQKVLR